MATPISQRIRRHRGNDARAVANVLIRKGIDSGKPITPLQIMKVLYFCHGWTLAQINRPLIRQRFEVWQFGPVVRDVYHALKRHQRNPVLDQIPGFESCEFDDDERAIVDKVFDDYGHVNGLVLSYLTHVPGGPWDRMRMQYGEGVKIPNWAIQQYFASHLESPAPSP